VLLGKETAANKGEEIDSAAVVAAAAAAVDDDESRVKEPHTALHCLVEQGKFLSFPKSFPSFPGSINQLTTMEFTAVVHLY
jgi:hypothetical protein